MQRHAFEVERPQDVVFRYAEDPENAPKWAEGLVRLEVDGEPGKVGATYTMVVREGRRENEYEGRVLAWDEGTRTQQTAERGGMVMTMERRYEPVTPDRTRVTMTVDMYGVPWIIRPLAALMNRHILRKQGTTLKRLIEQEK